MNKHTTKTRNPVFSTSSPYLESLVYFDNRIWHHLLPSKDIYYFFTTPHNHIQIHIHVQLQSILNSISTCNPFENLLLTTVSISLYPLLTAVSICLYPLFTAVSIPHTHSVWQPHLSELSSNTFYVAASTS